MGVKDIHERIYKFVVTVLKILKKLPNTPENFIIRNQVARSITSMGANDNEADGADTKKDFIHKYSIVRKEGKESKYWLSLIADTNSILEKETRILIKENQEINNIVSTIIYNIKVTLSKLKVPKPIH
jgi:four helix bundle protein